MINKQLNNNNMTNKIPLIIIISLSLIMCITCATYKDNQNKKQTEINSYNNNYKYIIQLPDDYKYISTDSNRPDILISYIKNDTLYLQFKDN